MGRDRKWTMPVLLQFYSSVRQQFGPCYKWDFASYPSEAKRREYEQISDSLCCASWCD